MKPKREAATAGTLERRIADQGAGAIIALAGALSEAPGGELDELAVAVARGVVGPRAFADLSDRALSRAGRSAAGTHPTPWRLATWLATQLAPGTDEVVLDPACGTGHLLVAAAEVRRRPPSRWLGWDVCPGRAAATRIALWLAHQRRGRPADYVGVRAVDSLLGGTGVAPPTASADVLIVNPPFVSIRELARSWGPAYVAKLRALEPAVAGSFDLYVPFLLKLRGWLAASGRFGAIVPATFWSAVYASCARRALAGHLIAAHRISGRGVFPEAAVTTHVLLGAARSVPSTRLVFTDLSGSEERSRSEGSASPEELAESGYPAGKRRPTRPVATLGELAWVTAGTPGYHAARIAAGLSEADASESQGAALPFVVTGCVDRYHLATGPVRFLRRRWRRPVLQTSVLSPGKRALFAQPKVVVAGVSRQIEAARDATGVALGVGVYAIVPERLSTELVLALLNSRPISDWYRRRFLGRELSGGYFAVNVTHLKQVPVPRAWLEPTPATKRLTDLVRRREQPGEARRHGEIDEAIDAIVADSLGLAPEQPIL